MTITNPYIIEASYISISNHKISSGNASTYTVNVSNYDDSKVLSYIHALQDEVESIKEEYAKPLTANEMNELFPL